MRSPRPIEKPVEATTDSIRTNIELNTDQHTHNLMNTIITALDQVNSITGFFRRRVLRLLMRVASAHSRLTTKDSANSRTT